MGFTQPTGSVLPSQVVASLGGSFILQLPPPDNPAPPSSQQIVLLFLALALLLAFARLMLPKKCRKFACCKGKGRHE